jgi:hypothetical protein
MSSNGKNSSTVSGKSSVSQTVGRSVFTVSSSFHLVPPVALRGRRRPGLCEDDGGALRGRRRPGLCEDDGGALRGRRRPGLCEDDGGALRGRRRPGRCEDEGGGAPRRCGGGAPRRCGGGAPLHRRWLGLDDLRRVRSG